MTIAYSELTGASDGWTIRGDTICVTAGAGGTIEGQADLTEAPNSAASKNTSTFSLDTTSSQVIKVTVQMNTASASASTTQREMISERLN